MAKVNNSPYWPANKCEVKDEELAKSLHLVSRGLVALIGESGGLRALRLEENRPFDGNVVEEEDLEEAPKNIRNQLDEVRVSCLMYVWSPLKVAFSWALFCLSYAFLMPFLFEVHGHGSTNRLRMKAK